LKNNQVGAVCLIIEYIIKYQNNYVSSYLFLSNLPDIMEKGISVAPLLNSNVFNNTFDYDEWPGTHVNKDTYLRPYNDSIFNLRDSYRIVFPEKEFASIDELGEKKVDNSKVYKIKYSINILASVCKYIRNDQETGAKEVVNPDVYFMALCTSSEELDIFETTSLSDLI
jgi:hypothetical protein